MPPESRRGSPRLSVRLLEAHRESDGRLARVLQKKHFAHELEDRRIEGRVATIRRLGGRNDARLVALFARAIGPHVGPIDIERGDRLLNRPQETGQGEGAGVPRRLRDALQGMAQQVDFAGKGLRHHVDFRLVRDTRIVPLAPGEALVQIVERRRRLGIDP